MATMLLTARSCERAAENPFVARVVGTDCFGLRQQLLPSATVEAFITSPGLYRAHEINDDGVTDLFLAVVARGDELVAVHVSDEAALTIAARVQAGERFEDVARLQEERVGEELLLRLLI